MTHRKPRVPRKRTRAPIRSVATPAESLKTAVKICFTPEPAFGVMSIDCTTGGPVKVTTNDVLADSTPSFTVTVIVA